MRNCVTYLLRNSQVHPFTKALFGQRAEPCFRRRWRAVPE